MSILLILGGLLMILISGAIGMNMDFRQMGDPFSFWMVGTVGGLIAGGMIIGGIFLR